MRFSRALTRPALVLLVLAAATSARGQFRAGPEFRVNSYTTSEQYLPSVAVGREGEVVVVWQSDTQDGSSYGVFGQLFRDDGSPRGAEFQVNTYIDFVQQRPLVAADGEEFVVAWTSYGQDGDGYTVLARRFEWDGTPLGGEFQVNTNPFDGQRATSVAKDRRRGRRGGFVVVWTDDGQDYGSIMAQRYDAAGAALGGEFRVNVNTSYAQTGGLVSAADDGRFVVAWNSVLQDGDGYGVFVRRFDANGTPLGGDLQVNTTTKGDQRPNGLAVARDGSFVVVWDQREGVYLDVFGQRFDAAGQRQGAEFRVNTYTTRDQRAPSVAVNERGDFVVTWDSFGQDGDGRGVFGQRFDRLGSPRGQEFRVHTFTVDDQHVARVSMDEVGNFSAVWGSFLQDGHGWGVYAQRFGGILFPALAVDTTASLGPLASDGNGVLEPGETVTVETSWRNVSGVAQAAMGGHVNGFTGPAGPTYGVPDPNASFGTIPNGATVACSVTQDCYMVGVSGARPATHWDGVLEEAVNATILGQVKLWDIHVGDSFTDVPRTNPFYRFIETLLHNGVTAGCSATQYCPQSSTSREQMSVFVLVAKEGVGYAPPACTTPVFDDVPPSSPFCRFIEELFRRGVVGGCAPDLYCPTSPVTREQMAVFVLRTLDPALDPPACAPPNLFADVPESSPFCRWIEELARRGVVSGCGGGNYCPTAPVTREQMGVFLTVTFGLNLYGP